MCNFDDSDGDSDLSDVDEERKNNDFVVDVDGKKPDKPDADVKASALRIIKLIHSKNLEGLKIAVGEMGSKIAKVLETEIQINFNASTGKQTESLNEKAITSTENQTESSNLKGTKSTETQTELNTVKGTTSTEKQEESVNKVATASTGRQAESFNFNANVLCIAMKCGSYEICKYLVEEVIQDFKLFEKTHKKMPYTAFHCAAINEDPNIFQMLFDKKIITDVNILGTLRKNTPLHYACKFGTPANVKALLSMKGVDYKAPNCEDERPIHFAAYGGHVESIKHILEMYEKEDMLKYRDLLEIEKEKLVGKLKSSNKYKKSDSKTHSKEEIALKLSDEDFQKKLMDKARKNVEMKLNYKFGESCLKLEGKRCGVPLLCAAIKVRSGDESDRHFQCIKFILESQMYADSTCVDEVCDTVLHLLSSRAGPEQIATLLKANALLGVKNEDGCVPLDYIRKKTMVEVLNKQLQLVKGNSSTNESEYVGKQDEQIQIHNIFGHSASSCDIRNILALAKSSKHQNLVKHPVCQSILSVKWQKLWKYFFIKLLFFFPFVVLLSVYPTLKTELQNSNDTMTKAEIQANMEITWHVLYLLLLIQVFFGTLSVLVLIIPFWRESKSYLSKIKPIRIRRFLEFYWNEFLWSDCDEYILWILTFLLLHGKMPPLPVVIVSWYSLFRICSNHPSILPFRFILTHILWQYLKFFFFAFGLVSGFAMSFYLLLKHCKREGQPCVNGAFSSIATTALKVPVMMMGDVDFESFSLDKHDLYVNVLYGSFVFLIACCLFNMINALAINVTDEIMFKADIYKTIAVCDMTYEFEILLKGISYWLRWFHIPKINFLSPISIESLLACPISGKCLIMTPLKSKSKQKKRVIDLKSLLLQFNGEKSENGVKLAENRFGKGKWYWRDRGYSLDRDIIRKAFLIYKGKLDEKECVWL